MELDDWDYCDSATLIEDVAARVPLRAGDVYLVLVAHPSREQRIERVELLDLDAEQDDFERAETEIERVLTSWPIPDVHSRTHGVTTIVVRPGFTVVGPTKTGWLLAWRYCHHGRQCFDTDLILVTEHGWMEVVTHAGGEAPALVPA